MAADTSGAARRGEIKSQLRQYILRELVRNAAYPLRDDEAMISGGLIDSFSLAQIGVFIEEAFDIYVPDSDLTVAQMDSLEMMVDQVLRHDPSAKASSQ